MFGMLKRIIRCIECRKYNKQLNKSLSVTIPYCFPSSLNTCSNYYIKTKQCIKSGVIGFYKNNITKHDISNIEFGFLKNLCYKLLKR